MSQNLFVRGLIASGVAAVFALTASAETLAPKSAVQRNWTSCATGGAVGAVAGGWLGSQLGKKSKTGGNLGGVLGGAAGAVVGCKVFDALAEKDLAELAATEVEAANAGVSSRTWRSETGSEMSVKSRSEPVNISGRPDAKCKKVTSRLTPGDGSESVSEQVYCDAGDGTYQGAKLVL